MKKLPDTKSELLTLTLQQVEKIEKSEKHVIDLTNWHSEVDGKIALCFAGTLIKWMLGSKIRFISDEYLTPDSFVDDVRDKLQFIDNLTDKIQIGHGPFSVVYDKNPKKFKKAFKKIIKYYKKKPELDGNQDWSI